MNYELKKWIKQKALILKIRLAEARGRRNDVLIADILSELSSLNKWVDLDHTLQSSLGNQCYYPNCSVKHQILRIVE
jgi:hypothetical protein